MGAVQIKLVGMVIPARLATNGCPIGGKVCAWIV